jgi:glycosyltransferase involved in cell wall biosynthesis
MTKEFLSICIPTRNRSIWLGKALSKLAVEIKANNIGPDILRIYVSDNCSTDDTETKARSFQLRLPHLVYSRHLSNLGGDPNILHCYSLGAGEYRWVMGDDDAIYSKTLGYILDCLRSDRPALFLNRGGGYDCGFKTPKLFGSYREFALTCMLVNPHMLIAHSLISANIFRADCFNRDFAISKLRTSYGHMYGMVDAMSDMSGGVFVTNRQTITVRNSSLDAVDGVWPADMYKLWGDYLDWIKSRFELNDLDRNNIPVYIRRALFLELKAHPLETAWRYGQNLNRAQTWKSFLKLLKKP